MDEISGFQSGDLRHHLQEQGIGSNVEGHSLKNVRTTLVQLQAQPSVGDIELEESVAGREVHVVQIAYIQCADYYQA